MVPSSRVERVRYCDVPQLRDEPVEAPKLPLRTCDARVASFATSRLGRLPVDMQVRMVAFLPSIWDLGCLLGSCKYTRELLLEKLSEAHIPHATVWKLLRITQRNFVSAIMHVSSKAERDLGPSRADLFGLLLNNRHYFRENTLLESAFISIAEQVPQLTVLDLDGCGVITDDGLAKILKRCTQIERLDIGHCAEITPKGVAAIAHRCTQLRSLRLHGTCRRKAISASLEDIMERNRQLTHLNLAYCSVTPVSLAIVLNKHGTRLQKLNLRGCCATDEYLGPQLQSCRKLVRLDLSHCSRLTDKTLAHIANSCPCLEKLFLRDCWRVTAVGLISLAHGCTQLMCIDIKNCNVSGTLFVPRKTSIPLEVLR